MQFLGDQDTRFFGVFGDPVKHSKSPVMMNRAFEVTGYNGVYGAFHISAGQLGDAVAGIRALDYKGVNVTIPHKVDVMPYLDEIDEAARVIGAVNTIVNENGRLLGYNTDGIGYVRSLKEETGIALAGKEIVMIGAGGAARGVVHALAQEQPAKIWIVNRTREKAEELAAQLQSHAPMEGVHLDDLKDLLPQSSLLVNNTPIGMHPNVAQTPVSKDWLHPNLVVSDLIYNPIRTRMLHEAVEVGCTVHGGLGMFIYQGAYAFEYWTGQQAPVEEMRAVVVQALEENKR
ncbi:shikimate dehydrogenase [Marinicrinis sediminis]|uniref:Shikimate dehydrogenase (NADP(+)) n=1 Tax=Marinicrinis sediminis TaxID=1652465 RepID=A0ABW5RAI8_9BACL